MRRYLDVSLKLLGIMQDRSRSEARRMRALAKMLRLDRGFWHREIGQAPESLMAFLERAGKIAISQNTGLGARRLDARDVAQDVVIAFFTKAHRIRKNPRAWLIGVAVRTVKYGLLREPRRKDGVDTTRLPAPEILERARGERPEEQLRLWAAIEKLPDQLKNVIKMHMDGTPDSEIARILHIGAPTVRKHLSRARHHLRKLLA